MNLLIAITVNNTEVLRDQSRIHISHRKISQLNEVIQFRRWILFKMMYAFLLCILRKIKRGTLPDLNMGNPVFKDKMKKNYKMVSKNSFHSLYESILTDMNPRMRQKEGVKIGIFGALMITSFTLSDCKEVK